MNEFQFINSIKQNVYKQKSLIKGVGDDAAVFRTSNQDIVTAVDTFVEDIHFSSKTAKPFHIGYKSLAANISDIAAMGAVPKFYLVSIVIPEHMDAFTLKEIYSGLNEIAAQYNIDLIGGDTVSGEILTISITIIGYVEKDRARYRHNARHNDVVFVTGVLGDSAAGLHILMNGLDVCSKERFIKKHQQPEPRVAFANAIKGLERVSLNDVSDGIANELREIAEASSVTIIIEDKDIPISEQLKQFPIEQQDEWKYFGGEDFELVGTVHEQDWSYLQESAKKVSLQITKIGNVTYNEEMSGQVFVNKNNVNYTLEKLGYIHLK